MSELEVVGFGKVRCLHCGELVALAGDIHFCNALEEEWLKKQKVAIIQMPNGNLWDMKNRKVVSQFGRKVNK